MDAFAHLLAGASVDQADGPDSELVAVMLCSEMEPVHETA